MQRMFINTVSYQFNKICDEESTNEDIYMESFVDLIEHVFSFRGNGTCIMYGQTGTGKTYTMSNIENFLSHDIFNQRDVKTGKVSISMCCFEISGKKCYDLFNFEERKSVSVKENLNGDDNNVKVRKESKKPPQHNEVFLREGEDKQIHVRGVKYVDINNEDELMKYIEISRKERTSSSTCILNYYYYYRCQ